MLWGQFPLDQLYFLLKFLEPSMSILYRNVKNATFVLKTKISSDILWSQTIIVNAVWIWLKMTNYILSVRILLNEWDLFKW